MAQEEDDPQLFVALYDFQAGGENQLSLKKGDHFMKMYSMFLFFFLFVNSISKSTIKICHKKFINILLES